MTARVVPNAAFDAQLDAIIEERLDAVVAELADEVRSRIDTSFPPASEPGSPPHKRTGGLQDSVFSDLAGPLEAAFGYQADPDVPDKGIYMELGTGMYRHAPDGQGGMTPNPNSDALTHVQPRPALLPVLMERGPDVAASHFGGL